MMLDYHLCGKSCRFADVDPLLFSVSLTPPRRIEPNLFTAEIAEVNA